MRYRLVLKDSGRAIGEIDEYQLQNLIDLLEEEASTDRDYYVDLAVLQFMETQGADPALIAMLRPHVGDETGVEIEWQKL